MKVVSDWASANGFVSTYGMSRPGENYTSAYDCALFIRKAENGELPHSSDIISLLKQQQFTHKIPSGLPEGVVSGNKTGELDTTQNDAAIVYAPAGTYEIAVLSDNVDSDAAIARIRDISSLVYHYLNG